LIDNFYKYVDNKDYNLNFIVELQKYISVQLDLLGLEYRGGGNQDNKLDKYIDTILNIRDDVRSLAQSKVELKEKNKKLYELSDAIRDNKLKELGIKVEDLNGKTKWVKLP
jgi:cysteinyl-tRNA synthetase